MDRIIKDDVEFYSYPKLRDSQLLQLSLLKKIDKICRDNKLQYWIDSGSLLGTIRHQGFIPWDDDLDICLLKADYDTLLELLSLESEKDANVFLKYYKSKKLQSYVDYFCSAKMLIKETNGTLTPCHIDIFPMKLIEDSPEAKLEDQNHTDMAYYYMHGNYRYSTKSAVEKVDSLENAAKLKRGFFSFYNDDYMNRNMDRKNKSDLLLSYSYGSILLKKEYDYYKYDDVFPLKKAVFEDFNTFVPNNFDAYLKKLYGDYMQLPRFDQRVPFNVSAFDVEQKKRKLIREQYLKKSEVFNLSFYFTGKRLGKLRLVFYYMRKLGVVSTIKGLKVFAVLRNFSKQPVFQRVFIKSN